MLQKDEFFVAVKLFSKFSLGVTNTGKFCSWGLDLQRSQNLDKIMQSEKDIAFKFYIREQKAMKPFFHYSKEEDLLTREKIKTRVFAGENYSMVLTDNREIIIWGSNKEFQHGTTEEEIKNFYVPFL